LAFFARFGEAGVFAFFAVESHSDGKSAIESLFDPNVVEQEPGERV